MTEQEKLENVIKGLECCLGKGQKRGMCEDCPYNTGRMKCNLGDMHVYALALLKAQEPLTDVSISSAIECLLHPQDADESDMVKAIDTAVRAMRLLKEQEPIEPKIIDTSSSKLYHSDMFKNYYCGNCGEFLHVINRRDMFCSQCGRKVKWE